MKSNFEGHNKRSSNNVHAYASVYGDSCLNGLNQISWHYAEVRALGPQVWRSNRVEESLNQACLLANAFFRKLPSE